MPNVMGPRAPPSAATCVGQPSSGATAALRQEGLEESNAGLDASGAPRGDGEAGPAAAWSPADAKNAAERGAVREPPSDVLARCPRAAGLPDSTGPGRSAARRAARAIRHPSPRARDTRVRGARGSRGVRSRTAVRAAASLKAPRSSRRARGVSAPRIFSRPTRDPGRLNSCGRWDGPGRQPGRRRDAAGTVATFRSPRPTTSEQAPARAARVGECPRAGPPEAARRAALRGPPALDAAADVLRDDDDVVLPKPSRRERRRVRLVDLVLRDPRRAPEVGGRASPPRRLQRSDLLIMFTSTRFDEAP